MTKEPKMSLVEGDYPAPVRPEDLDDEAWLDLLDLAEDAAERSHLVDRERLIATAAVDSKGRLVKPAAEGPHSNDGGGW
jgi:hypothetical protein